MKFRVIRLILILTIAKAIIVVGAVFAQEKNSITANRQNVINGSVKDAQGGPLPGVNVIVKGTKIATTTDNDGKFTIRGTNSNSILVFSYIGYNTQEWKAGNGTVLNIVLTDAANALNEIVVVGYGTQLKSELTGSVSSIKADQIEQFAGGSLNTSLQGKIAGLQITTDSGEPGAGANISLRGVSSINGSSSPLIIIDGIPVNNDSFESADDGANFSPLNDINPADIESIEVLKDAATASIYGSRASNGVILITTKGGKGQPANINASVNSSIVGLSRKIGMLNGPQWRNAIIDATYNSTGTLSTRVSIIDSLYPHYKESYNWQEIMYRTANQYKADISASGSSKDKNMDYYISVGYRDQEPIIIHSKYKQLTSSARVNYVISKRLSGTTNFRLTNYDYNRQNTGNTIGGIVRRYLTTFPVYSPYDPITGEVVPFFEVSRISPFAQAIYTKNEIKRWRLLGKQELTFNIAKGLDFKSNIAVDYSNTETSYFQPPKLSTNGSGRSIYSIYSPTQSTDIINENILTWKRRFNNVHSIDLLLGQSYQLSKRNSTYIRGIGSIDNIITTIGGTAVITNNMQRLEEYILSSIFSRANYNYKSKYLFSALIRRDGSSRFGADKRYAYFPSASAGWVFSKEEAFKNIKFLSSGKLRASYGITGNQNIGNYSALGLYENPSTSYLGGVSVVSTTLPNPNLKWETTKQLDIGVDLSFFKNRISLTADYYVKNTSDLLFNVQIPSQIGYTTIPYNFGSLSNKGFDFELSGVLINKKTFGWNSTFTFGLNRNKVTALPDDADYFANTYTLARVGQPVGIFYGYKALGVYARDEDNVYKTNPDGSIVPYRRGSANGQIYKGGSMIYEDVNGDGLINDDDLQVIGDPTPDFFGGLQNTFRYKNFSLSAFVNYVIGADLFNNLKRSVDGNSVTVNYTTDQLRRWRNQGDITDVPQIIAGDPMQNYAVSSRFIEDGSFIRLQSLTLGYNVNKKWISKIGVKNASVGVGAQNLLTFGSYTGYDPEINEGTGAFSLGVDNGAFPKSRYYNFFINIKL